MSDIKVLLFFYLEEGIAAVLLGLTLMGIRPGFKKIILIGALQGLAVFMIRYLYSLFNIQLGTHFIFTVLTMLIFIKLITKAKWGIALASTMSAFIAIAISESLMYALALNFFGLTWEKAVNDPSLHILTAYIGDSLMFVLAVLVGITNFSLFKR